MIHCQLLLPQEREGQSGQVANIENQIANFQFVGYEVDSFVNRSVGVFILAKGANYAVNPPLHLQIAVSVGHVVKGNHKSIEQSHRVKGRILVAIGMEYLVGQQFVIPVPLHLHPSGPSRAIGVEGEGQPDTGKQTALQCPLHSRRGGKVAVFVTHGRRPPAPVISGRRIREKAEVLAQHPVILFQGGHLRRGYLLQHTLGVTPRLPIFGGHNGMVLGAHRHIFIYDFGPRH